MEEQVDDNWTTLGDAVVGAIQAMAEALRVEVELHADEAGEGM